MSLNNNTLYFLLADLFHLLTLQYFRQNSLRTTPPRRIMEQFLDDRIERREHQLSDDTLTQLISQNLPEHLLLKAIIFQYFPYDALRSSLMHMPQFISRRICSSSRKEVQSGDNANDLYFETPPVIWRGMDNDLEPHFVAMRVEGHDQGWASGDGSWSWYEASVYLPDEGFESARVEIYTNQRANSNYRVGERVWSVKDLLSELGIGEKFASNAPVKVQFRIYMLSLYPGWKNYCTQAEVEVLSMRYTE